MQTQHYLPTSIFSGLSDNIRDFADMALKMRFVRALEDGAVRYPIHRSLRFAARVQLEALFDDLAMNLGWRAQHPSSRAFSVAEPG